MRPVAALLGALVLGAAALAAVVPASVSAGSGRGVLLLRVDGPIGPATASYVERGLRHAAAEDDVLVILELDTPGGLDLSMRAIIQAILASPVPVATYVWPAGARAASAGTYILYASPVAAMAPATTLGAATPIALGAGGPVPAGAPGASAASSAAPAPADALEAKRVSDAAAYIHSLALLHGRNADWAERAVREAASLPSSQALAQHVVDVVAVDVPDLLAQLDGRNVHNDARHSWTLATAGAPVRAWEPDWRDRLLGLIGDPSLALVLMALGFYGLVFEFSNPGLVAPGVAGALCLLLGLYGLQTLPVDGTGIALVLLGLGFFAAEAFVPTHGALALGGLSAFVLGAVMLVDSRAPALGIPVGWIAGLGLLLLAGVVGLGRLGARARRRPACGPHALLDSVGEVLEAEGGRGWARVDGETWQVHAARGLHPGERVRVTGVEGLVLEVDTPEPVVQ